jgi:uncharacterized membrane protein YtjA (UPF0391 family)
MAFQRAATVKPCGNQAGADAFLLGNRQSRTVAMLNWATTFLVIAIIAAVLGFGGIVGAAVGIAKLLFYVFILLFVISFVMSMLRGRSL